MQLAKLGLVLISFAISIILIAGCVNMEQYKGNEESKKQAESSMNKNTKNLDKLKAAKATFAGGCFWCMEPPFEKIEGVLEVTSGYAGGEEENPTYKDVSSGTTGHVEVVQIEYDPGKISYKELLDVFWMQIDPTDNGGQFADRGQQYTTAVFYHSPEQKKAAEKSKSSMDASGRYDEPIATKIVAFEKFYPAEKYHQDYYKKNPIRYKLYRKGSGRDKYLNQIWSQEIAKSGEALKPSKEELKKKLTPLQYKVTQENGTEKAFDNEYWDNHEEGIYVDVVSGEPLFSSTDKFESGTGWPSFIRPLVESNIVEQKDFKLIIPRTEVRSKNSDSHLGHLFKDGPEPTGLRYCINSAALKFVPKAELEEQGYGEFIGLFE